MAFVDQFLDGNSTQGSRLVLGKRERLLNGIAPLLRRDSIGPVFFVPGSDTLDKRWAVNFTFA
jgi:hypothetical protein